MTRAVDKRDVSDEFVVSFRPFARERVFFGASGGNVGRGSGKVGVIALIDFGVGVAEFDGDVLFQLVLESNCLDAGERLDDGGFSVGDVADGADVAFSRRSDVMAASAP